MEKSVRESIIFPVIAWSISMAVTSAIGASLWPLTAWGWGLLVGTAFVIAIPLQMLLSARHSPRHMVLASLAFEGMRRRRRSTALVLAALMIGSAIVSSSLIVGDSLDETISGRLIESLGESDIVVAGIDPLTGQSVWMDESRMREVLDGFAQRPDVDAVSLEISRPTAAINQMGDRAEPYVVWLAADPDLRSSGSWPPLTASHGWGDLPEAPIGVNATPVGVNEAFAESLAVGIGDEFEATWSDVSLLDGVTRNSARFVVTSLISGSGLGWPVGDQAVFVTLLSTAQELQGVSGQVNRLVLSGTGDVRGGLEHEPRIVADLSDSLDEALIGEDIGLTVSGGAPGGIAIISSTGAGGLLSVESQEMLAESFSEAGLQVAPTGIIQVPIAALTTDGIDTIGLPHPDVSAVALTADYAWFATGDGLGILNLESGRWRTWSDGDRLAALDLVPIDDVTMAVGHADGISIVSSSGEEVARGISTDRVVSLDVAGGYLHALSIEGSNASIDSLSIEAILAGDMGRQSRVLGITGKPLTGSLATDGEYLYAHVDMLVGSATCQSSAAPSIGNSDDAATILCETDVDSRTGIVSHGGLAWTIDVDGLHGLSTDIIGFQSADLHPGKRVIAASETAILVEGGSLLTWNGSGFVLLAESAPVAATEPIAHSNRAGISMMITGASWGAELTNSNATVPLFSESFELGLSRSLPPIAIAVDGPLSNRITPVANGSFSPSFDLNARLGLEPDAQVGLLGYVAAATGDLDEDQMTLASAQASPADLLGDESELRLLDPSFLGYLSISDAEELVGSDGVRMLLLVDVPTDSDSADSIISTIADWTDATSDLSSSPLSIDRTKRVAIESTEGAGASFSALFLIFGSFVMLAGILLLINVFVMLADDRRNELGILRAIGLQRSGLRWLLLVEGTSLALVASAIGTVLGLGLARTLMWGMDQALASTFGGSFSFGWEPTSLLAGYVVGVLVTMITLGVTAFVVGRRNVIATIRRLPDRAEGLPWWSLLISFGLLGGALTLALLTFMIGESESGSGHAYWTSAGFLALVGLTPPVHMLLDRLLPAEMRILGRRLHRRTTLPKLSVAALGVSMVMWGAWNDPVRQRYEPSDWSFIVLGAFLVTAGVLLLATAGPWVARRLARWLTRRRPRAGAVLPTALAHPLATPFRTSLTMGMYSLVVFAVVVLAGYSALFGGYIEELGERSRGEFEIVILSGSEGLDLDPDSSSWDLGEANASDFDAIACLSSVVVLAEPAWSGEPALDGNSENEAMEDGGVDAGSDDERSPSPTYRRLMGFDRNFTDHGALPLQKWSPNIGDGPAEIWDAVATNDTYAIIDSRMHATTYLSDDGTISKGGGIELGEPIEIRDPQDPLVVRTVWVVGVLEEESGLLLSGILVSAALAEGSFDARTQMVWMSVAPHMGLEEQNSVAEKVQIALVSQRAYVLVIGDLFADLQSFLLAMFGLLRSFLALGLSVGIAGLGVVTVRNVSERRLQIGVMRAIGFQRDMVVHGFVAEISWISVLGVVNGVLVGIVFHHALWDRYLREEGAAFVLPWGSIAAVAVGALLFTMLATAAPVRRASMIEAAEALRTDA